MKNLVRKLLLPVGIATTLLFPQDSFSQDSLSTQGKFSPRTYIASSYSYYIDNDPEVKKIYKSIGGFSMPETIFVNSNGEIVVHKRGPMELGEMREYTNKIVNKENSL